MTDGQINIRASQFTKEEIKVIEDCLKEWNRQDSVEIIYVAEGTSDKVDATFILNKEDLGEFLWIILDVGWNSLTNSSWPIPN